MESQQGFDKLCASSKLRVRVDILTNDISNLAEIAFQGEDVEFEWEFFRSELSKLKKKHKIWYEEYLESEDDTEYPETEWQKFKRERSKE